jgi:large subunit ribosomal protein L18
MSLGRKWNGRQRRQVRIRKKVLGTLERPRLNVFRSAKHIYVQVIDDVAGVTLAAASTLAEDVAKAKGKKSDKAQAVGKAIAAACKSKNIEAVVFDRGGYRYHGRVKAIAEAAREGGLKF